MPKYEESRWMTSMSIAREPRSQWEMVEVARPRSVATVFWEYFMETRSLRSLCPTFLRIDMVRSLLLLMPLFAAPRA